MIGRCARLALCGITFALAVAPTLTMAERPPYREAREPCADYRPTRQALFGDLHVHSRLSFDSYVSSQRNGPEDAYRYAKGEAITLPDADGEQTVIAQLQRPIDFTAVTDHSELLGPIRLCSAEDSGFVRWHPACVATRSDLFPLQLLAMDYWASVGVTGDSAGETESMVCSLGDCDAAHKQAWQQIQDAAEAHYDRSANCEFTTFVGYEYTDAPNYANLHRNVIFRNANVTDTAISTYDTGSRNVPELWRRLADECTDTDSGCDVMAIPHNPNLAAGLMFPDPANEQEAKDRLFFEPLIELVQHKAASECRFDRLLGRGVDTEDELCDFEQAPSDNLAMLGTIFGEMRASEGEPVSVDDFARRNMVRNVLKDGLALRETSGINPFMQGFIGSTDTHSASPGGAEEDNYTGHLGRRDSGYRNLQDHFYDNPGGLAVVWAEENSRDSVFDAMRRREAYATSGTRPSVRFFAGTDLAGDLCAAPDMLEQAYASGVPMGGELAAGDATPRFLVSAAKDPGVPGNPGQDLQRLQVIKGWLDADGNTQERVFDIAGDADNGAWVDEDSCAPTGAGAAQLCSGWEDPDYTANQRAFYYVRVLENPSCRWSTRQCQAAGVNPFSSSCLTRAEAMNAKLNDEGAIGNVYDRCCLAAEHESFYSPVIQERAWTSPIWINP